MRVGGHRASGGRRNDAGGSQGYHGPDDQLLLSALEDKLTEKRGRDFAIAEMTRGQLDSSHSYVSEVIRLRFENGDEIEVFVKDFGASTRTKDGILGMRERREREFLTYRDLLAGQSLGTPEYLGAVWGAHDRYLLLLEFVEGIQLRYSDFDNWVPAASWLARFQGRFGAQSDRLIGLKWLQVHDSDFFRERAEQAIRVLASNFPDFARDLEPTLKRYDRIIPFMASQPRMLVHGSFTPGTIFVRHASQSQLICPFDWELTALGSGLYDLAFLCDGFDDVRLDILWRAYEGEAMVQGVSVPSRSEIRYLTDCFRLHRVITFISQIVERDYSASDVRRLVRAVERLAPLVL